MKVSDRAAVGIEMTKTNLSIDEFNKHLIERIESSTTKALKYFANADLKYFRIDFLIALLKESETALSLTLSHTFLQP